MGNLNQTSPQFYRIPQLQSILNVSAQTIWAWVRKGTFPKPIKLAENTTAWSAAEVNEWAQARIDDSKAIDQA